MSSNYSTYNQIDLRNAQEVSTYINRIVSGAEDEIKSASSADLYDDKDYVESLTSKYIIDAPVEIDPSSRLVESLESVVVEKEDKFGDPYQQTLKRFRVTYSFTGEPKLFSYKSMVTMPERSNVPIQLSSISQRVGFDIQVSELNPQKVELTIIEHYKAAFRHIDLINKEVALHNKDIKSLITSLVRRRKSDMNDESDFLNKLNNR